MRITKCEICGEEIGPFEHGGINSFPITYNGNPDVIGDMCNKCKPIIKERFNAMIKEERDKRHEHI